MTIANCEMATLVEARRDGRLGDAEAASVDRHLDACASCRALAADLARLGELAAGEATRPATDLDRRRGRLRLLQAAARPHGEPRRRVRPWQFAAAAALLVG